MRLFAPVFFAAVLSACTAAHPVEPSRTADRAAAGEAVGVPPRPGNQIVRTASCAGWAEDTDVSVEDTTHGAALVFSTSGDIVALRSRVAEQLTFFGQADELHLDNANQGIRVVFEPRDGKGTDARENVTRRGRELSKTCGLDFDARSDDKAKQAAKATPPPPAEPASPPSESPPADKPGAAATPPTDDSKKATDDAKAKDKKPGAAKPGIKPPPDGKKPKLGDKPKPGDKPKEPPPMPPEPPVPPLPPPPPPPPPLPPPPKL